jgi:hypothetical protein
VLSLVLVKGTMTGPLEPEAPSWMCAAVAVIPVAVIFALTAQSLTVTVPEPDADVVTAGTSFAPVSETRSPIIVIHRLAAREQSGGACQRDRGDPLFLLLQHRAHVDPPGGGNFGAA